MDMGIRGRKAIVCAASKGLGKGCAMALAHEGVELVINARTKSELEATAEEIRKKTGVKVTAVAVDVTTEAGRKQVLAACPEPDIVVNNAGGPPAGPFETTADEAWADAFELSLRSVVRLTRLALPHLRASGRGRVVNITSWSVREPIPNLILSNAIRPGVIGWAKSLAHEVGRDGITVNTIAPGKGATGRMRELWEARPDPAAAEAEDIASIPVGRMGEPAEIAAAVTFLCSERAGYISGVVLPVDGGALRGVW